MCVHERHIHPWVFRIPGVFGGKSGPYSTIFLWVGFPFGGQKQGQNIPKLVLFEFLVIRAFSGGTIKKLAWLHNRTVHSTQYTVHSTQYTVHSTQYTVHSTQYTGCPQEAKNFIWGFVLQGGKCLFCAVSFHPSSRAPHSVKKTVLKSLSYPSALFFLP